MRMPSDKEANAPVFAIDPTFGEMAVQMGEATWSIAELSQREKVLVCIAADVCMRDIELPLEMHVQMAAATSSKPANEVITGFLPEATVPGQVKRRSGASEAYREMIELELSRGRNAMGIWVCFRQHCVRPLD